MQRKIARRIPERSTSLVTRNVVMVRGNDETFTHVVNLMVQETQNLVRVEQHQTMPAVVDLYSTSQTALDAAVEILGGRR